MVISFIKKFFKSKDDELPFYKGAKVYYNQSNVLIASDVLEVARRDCAASPMNTCKLEIDFNELGQIVQNCIDHSRDKVPEEEFQEIIQKFFEIAGVKNWYGLTKKWEYFSVTLITENDIDYAHFDVMKKDETGRGYYAEISDPIFRCEYQPELIGNIASKIINGKLNEIDKRFWYSRQKTI